MKSTELSHKALLAATLTGSLTILPADARAQAPALDTTPRPASRPTTSRPRDMPCQIVVRHKGSNKIGEVYALYYRADGRLDKATSQTVNNECLTLNACRLSPAVVDLRYEYDEAGRLIETRMPHNLQRLTVTYDATGRPTRYDLIRDPDDGTVLKSETVITIDAGGRPAASLTRGVLSTERGSAKTRTTARFSGWHEPYTSGPVVWPYASDTLYLGWTRRSSTGSIVGVRAEVSEDEVVSFDREGRILKHSAAPGWDPRRPEVREFLYECPSERPVESVH